MACGAVTFRRLGLLPAVYCPKTQRSKTGVECRIGIDWYDDDDDDDDDDDHPDDGSIPTTLLPRIDSNDQMASVQ